QPDGRVVAAGASIAAGSLDFDFALARYNTDGTLDATFGTAGQVVTDFGPVFVGSDPSNCALPLADFRGVDVAFALALQPDGKLDPIFGAGGRVVTGVGNDAEAFALVLQPGDGRLLVAGAADGDFALARYEGDFATLGLTKAGTGSGTVTSDPAGLDCGATCSAPFPFDAVVNLTAIPAPGSVFTGWSGDPDCADGTVALNADKTCTATFDVLVPLTVTLGGGGAGTVTSDPAGIECGATCTRSYPRGTVVTLTATPAPGARFVG